MSTGLLAVAVVVGILLIMGLFYVSHTIEKQKAQKALMIANQSERALRLQRIIDIVPPAYLPKELKLVMLGQIKSRYEKLIELAPGNARFKKQLDSTAAQISDTQASSDKPPAPKFRTPQEANEIKTALQALGKTVESFVQSGSLPATTGQQHMASIQRSFIEANVNYLISQGDAARGENKAKLAVHHYQKALTELGKRNQDKRYSERIAQLEAMINQLNQQAGIAPEETAETGNELDKGLNNLIEEDNSWKKKYF